MGSVPLSVLFLVADDPSTLYFAIFMSAFLLMATIGPNATLIMNVVPLGLRATASALYLFLIHMLGDAISPAILGAISDFAQDLRTAFFIIPIVLSLSAWTAYKIVRAYPDDARRLETAIAGVRS
ncbi:MAG: hypothetical protein HYU64_05025 [Armatimonadetes bacterium]|nr:hypothetical protein [Armatimonadota bacterium]